MFILYKGKMFYNVYKCDNEIIKYIKDRINKTIFIKNNNIPKYINQIISKNEHYIVVSKEKEINGVFIFLIDYNEKYIEIMEALSDEKEVIAELIQNLISKYKGFLIDIVLNCSNVEAVKVVMETAKLDKKQVVYKKLLKESVKNDDFDVALLDSKYISKYKKIHVDENCFWTADRIINNLDKFNVYLLKKQNSIIGYSDVYVNKKFCEIYSFEISEEYKNISNGKKFLGKICSNFKNKELQIIIDYDDAFLVELLNYFNFSLEKEQITAHY